MVIERPGGDLDSKTTVAKGMVTTQLHAVVPGRGDEFVGGVLDAKYHILELLGRGGMSSVYLARHQLMKKMVAIKVLRTERADDAVAFKRLQQESQACAAMVHRNLVGVHDFGVTPDGTPYVVMDYVPGQSLASWIESQKPDVNRLLDVFVQVCDGLSYAHRHGVIHRDLKPGNIMVYADDEGRDIPKIVDFGIAKLVGPTEDELHRLTQTGETFGSPMYMSPEQCLAANLDPRSDIYSLGCVLFEAFTGKPPFGGGSMYEIVHQHINVMPPPMVVPGMNESSRRKIELLVMKALAKDVSERQSSMQELKEDLELAKHSTQEGLLASLKGMLDLWRVRLAPKVAPYTAVVAGGLIAISCLSMLGTKLFIDKASFYESALDNISHTGNICEIPSINFTDTESPLYEALNRADNAYTKGFFLAAAEEYVAALDVYHSERMQNPLLCSHILARLGDSEVRSGNFSSGIFDLDKAAKRAANDNVHNVDPQLEAAITSELAFAYHRIVVNEEIVLGRMGKTLQEDLGNVTPEEAAKTLHKMGSVWSGRKKLLTGVVDIRKTSFEKAEDKLATAARLWEALGEFGKAALCKNEMGSLKFDYGRQRSSVVCSQEFAGAEADYKEAIELLQKDPGLRVSREMCRVLENYFVLLWREHRYIEAFRTHNQVEDLKSQLGLTANNGIK
jgi:serine/threonine protein kinase